MRLQTFFRTLKMFLVACAGMSLLNFETASAQQRNNFGAGQRNRPTVSPFLSMVDTTGNGPSDGGSGLNYFNIVRPTLNARSANRRLQKELQGVESTIAQGPTGFGAAGPAGNGLGAVPITTGRLPETGHAAAFSDLGGRFGGGGGTQRAGGGNNRRGNTFGSNPGGGPSPGLGILNNTLRGNATPNGIFGGR